MNRIPRQGGNVILAAGDFPARGGMARQMLSSAKRVIACDSAAIAFYHHFHRWPDVIIGDLDSLTKTNTRLRKPKDRIVHVPDQDTNDLEKAIDYCKSKKWGNLSIVGACGKREDHTIGNIFRALESQVTMITDNGVFCPVCGKAVFHLPIGSAMSIFAIDPDTKVTSKGLEWPLDNVKFINPYCATLNRTIRECVTMNSSHPIYVFYELSNAL